MELIIAAGILYMALGGTVSMGQVMVSSLGKYVVWSRRQKLVAAGGAGFMTVLTSLGIFFFLDMDPVMFPFLMGGAVLIGKGGAVMADRKLGMGLTPGEVKDKFGQQLKMDMKGIDEIIQDDFTRRLFGRVPMEDKSIQAPTGNNVASVHRRPQNMDQGLDLDAPHEDGKGLRDAVEGFILKERRKKTK